MMEAEMRSWRTLVVLFLLGIWLSVGVAWGWRAAVVLGFFLALAGAYAAAASLWGDVLSRAGERHHDRLLNGRHR
jgi:hypothetical protein